MADTRYHVRFIDSAASDDLGLMLEDHGTLGYSRRLYNPYAAKTASGDIKYSDMREWSVAAFDDWRGGRGQDIHEEEDEYFDSHNVETRIEGQVTLGPLVQVPAGTVPQHVPGSVTSYMVGYPRGVSIVGDPDDVAQHPVPMLQGFDRIGQRFKLLPAYGKTKIESVTVYMRKDAAMGTTSVTLRIYADDGELPTGEILASKSLSSAAISTTMAAVTFTLDTALTITPDTWYWATFVTTATAGAPYYFARQFTPLWSNYYVADGTPTAWSTALSNKRHTLFFQVNLQKRALAQKFTAPTGGMNCTRVALLMRKTGQINDITVALHSDNAGVPGTLLKSDTLTDSDILLGDSWVQATWTTQALASETAYWLVVTPNATPDPYFSSVQWGGDAAGGYASGAAWEKWGDGSWAAISGVDLYFQVQSNALDGDVLAFARYDDAWYCAAGDTVYKWNTSTLVWDASDAVSGKNVTALEAWGDWLWAGRGADNVLRRYDGEKWTAITGTYAKLLKGGGGYLHRTGGTPYEHLIYYTNDGDTWLPTPGAIEVGPGDYPITALAWYRDQLVASTAVRLWGIAADTAYPLVDWPTQEDSHNGMNMTVWGKDGALYIPLRFGLYRFNGEAMVAVGPEQGTGLPAGRVGKIAAMCGTGNWLYCAIDAGTSGTSSILAYNGMGGWHEMARANQVGERIRALGFETISSPNRLWLGMGDQPQYMKLPDYSDNPWQWTGYEYNSAGSLETSWVGNELLEVVKDLQEVVIHGEGITSAQPVDVFYEVDRSGLWVYLGTAVASPRQAFLFRPSAFAPLTLAANCTVNTIKLATGSVTTDLSVGDWVRINNEVSQVTSITDSNTFVLHSALSEAPAAGDIAYGSRPAGRLFRLKLVPRTTSNTSTPRVTAFFIRYQNNVLDRYLYEIQIRVQDMMKDVQGHTYPFDAASLRAKLDPWLRRPTPFTFEDPDGGQHLVKIISASEGGMSRTTHDGQHSAYKSTVFVTLVEVE